MFGGLDRHASSNLTWRGNSFPEIKKGGGIMLVRRLCPIDIVIVHMLVFFHRLYVRSKHWRNDDDRLMVLLSRTVTEYHLHTTCSIVKVVC